MYLAVLGVGFAGLSAAFRPSFRKVLLGAAGGLLSIAGLVAMLFLVFPWLLVQAYGTGGERAFYVGGISLITVVGALLRLFRDPLRRYAPRLGGVALGVLVLAVLGLAVHDSVVGSGAFAPGWVWGASVVMCLLLAYGIDTQTWSVRELYRARLTNSFVPDTCRPAPLYARILRRASDRPIGFTWAQLRGKEQVPELHVCCAASRVGLQPIGAAAEAFSISQRYVRHYRASGTVTVPTDTYVRSLNSLALELLKTPAGWLATSGAAFASAMGRASLGSTNALLAAANVDLGCSARMGAAMVAGVGKRVEVCSEDRVELERIVGAASSEVRMVERARIVLCAAEGLTAPAIAERVGCGEKTAKKWRGRYARKGIDGLRDGPRPGPPLTHGPETRALLIAKACTRPPATEEGARQERWTYEQLGAAVGMSGSQAHVILQRAAIKPHLTEYWIMSDFSQPEFEERCSAVCGLYVDPPENVLVVSIDEKTGIQAKAPTKPDVLPAANRAARREHEYKRNGTQCLFAALKVHVGDVLAMASKTRNRFDLIRFLDHLDSDIPVVEGQKIVAITDNLSTRGTREVQDWLKAHPRWSFQFTPTHASWLNQVEIFFSILYRRLLKHGIFTSEDDLAEQMLAYVETYNQTAKPFKWTYSGKVLEA